jgi:hypothetical protein
MMGLLAVFTLATHLYVLRGVYDFSWLVAMQDGLCSTVILCLSIWAVLLLIRSYPTTAAIAPYALLMALLTSSAAVFAGLQVIKLTAYPLCSFLFSTISLYVSACVATAC